MFSVLVCKRVLSLQCYPLQGSFSCQVRSMRCDTRVWSCWYLEYTEYRRTCGDRLPNACSLATFTELHVTKTALSSPLSSVLCPWELNQCPHLTDSNMRTDAHKERGETEHIFVRILYQQPTGLVYLCWFIPESSRFGLVKRQTC